MSQFHTKSQKRIMRFKMRRNDAVMRFVSEQLRDYDKERAEKGERTDHAARDSFAKLVLTRAQATLA